MQDRIVKSRYFSRFTEALIPIMTWGIITFPVWFSPFHPALVSYFILAFLLYFLYKTIRNIYYANISYRLMNKAEKIDWYDKAKSIKGFKDIHHFIIITNYKETAEKLENTLLYIKNQKFPLKNIHIVFAMEEREGDDANTRSDFLTKRFRNIFGSITTTYHVLVPGEVVGKASNEAHAARIVDQMIERMGISDKNTLITICDADSLLPSQYLSYLTLEYLEDTDRLYHFYWAPVLLYNNFWKLTIAIRVQSILASVLRLAFLSQTEDLIQISTYSTSLWLLKQVNYWDTDIIPEDWHVWLQAFFKFGKKVKTLPIYLPISGDAIMAKGWFNTFKNRYDQERRWAGGVSDVSYSIKRFFETPQIPYMIKLKKILLIVETHLLWPTSFFILTVSGWIPSLVNPTFKRTVMGLILPQVSSLIMTMSTILLLGVLYFDYKMREKVKIKTPLIHIPLLFIQWYLLPVISFLFSSLPALEAHTRLLLGKKLEYRVTEKM